MRMFSLALAAGLAAYVSGADATAACRAGPDSLFEDQFGTLDDTWGSFENYDVEGGKLVIKPPAGYNTSAINNSSLYDDVDICVEMTAEAPAQGDCGGIIFWALDYDNYYVLEVSTGDGQASFWRRQRGRWLRQVSWLSARAIETGPSVINELRVISKGKSAKLFINGTLFKEVKGQPPKDGSQIGLLACSPSDASARIGFDNLVVNTPSAETEPVSEKARDDKDGGGVGDKSGASSGSEAAPSGGAGSGSGGGGSGN